MNKMPKIINVLLSFNEGIESLKNDENNIGLCLYTESKDEMIKTIVKVHNGFRVYKHLFSKEKEETNLTFDNILQDKWMIIIK